MESDNYPGPFLAMVRPETVVGSTGKTPNSKSETFPNTSLRWILVFDEAHCVTSELADSKIYAIAGECLRPVIVLPARLSFMHVQKQFELLRVAATLIRC